MRAITVRRSSLEARNGAVQRARAQAVTKGALDIQHHLVAVLGALRQADQDQEARLGEAFQRGEFILPLRRTSPGG
jgi:hypothetical protein